MPIFAQPEALEGSVVAVASWLKLGIEAVSIGIILIAILMAVGRLVAQALRRGTPDIRNGLAKGLSLALEFQLAADIVGTAISPDWNQIGKLAAVAAIRTFLNIFLQREMNEGGQGGGRPKRPSGTTAPDR